MVRRTKENQKIIEEVWKSISSEAKDLIKKLLTQKPGNRISAQDALQHPWLKKKDFTPFDPKTAKQVLTQLQNFNVWFFFGSSVPTFPQNRLPLNCKRLL